MAEKTNYTQGYSIATLASHTSRTVESEANFVIPYIKPTDNILDVGCGPGTITVGFAALAHKGSVIGIDISKEVLSNAREALSKGKPASTPTNLTFQRVDLLAAGGLPFPDNTFDIVFSSQLFPHLPTHSLRIQALREMRRVLKPGGILASRDAAQLNFYPEEKYDLKRLWEGNMLKALRTPHLPGSDMPSLFHEIGFEAGKFKVGAGTTVYAGGEGRRWFADVCKGRLERGETFRESWIAVGIKEEEVEGAEVALNLWAADEGAWYVALQAEVLGWK